MQNKLESKIKSLYLYDFDSLCGFFDIVRQDSKQQSAENSHGKPKGEAKQCNYKRKNDDKQSSSKKNKNFCKHCTKNHAPDWVINNHYSDKCNDPTGGNTRPKRININLAVKTTK